MAEEFIFPPGTPEEFQEKVQAMLDRQAMQQTVHRQTISRFFQEMSQEQLETLSFLMSICANNPVAAGFYEGFARSTLAWRFDKWPGWDENEEHGISVVEIVDEDTEGEPVTVEPEPEPEPEPEDLYKKYNVKKIIHGPQAGKVVCLECGVTYVSVADRALRPAGAEGCHGCVEKEKWG